MRTMSLQKCLFFWDTTLRRLASFFPISHPDHSLSRYQYIDVEELRGQKPMQEVLSKSEIKRRHTIIDALVDELHATSLLT
jgi:hypothetical protein